MSTSDEPEAVDLDRAAADVSILGDRGSSSTAPEHARLGSWCTTDGEAQPPPDQAARGSRDLGVARWWHPLPPSLPAGRRSAPRSRATTGSAAVGAVASSTAAEGDLEPPISGPPPSREGAEGDREKGGSGPSTSHAAPIDLGCGPAAIGSSDPAGTRTATRERVVRASPIASAAAGRGAQLPIGACVMPPRLDGGTRCWIDLTSADVAAIPSEFFAILREIKRARSIDESRADAQRGGRVVQMPHHKGGPFDREALASCGASGERNQRVWFMFEDMIRVNFDLERSPRDGFAARMMVEFKARLLHSAIDQRQIVGDILCEAHWWLTGDEVARSDLGKLGWRAANLEICSDFFGVKWHRNDVGNFVTPSSLMKSSARGEKLDHHTIGKDPLFAETLGIGTRASNCSFVLYDKSEEIHANQGDDATKYSAIWESHGLDESWFHMVARVEFRLKGYALVWTDPNTGEMLDLRDPMVACDPNVLARVWAMLCDRVRLFLPTSTRRKRCKTDPRWEHVRRATDAEAEPLRQHREANSNAHAAAVFRAMRAATRATQRIAALHDARITDSQGYASMMAMALRKMSEVDPGVPAQLAVYGERYRCLRVGYMGDEIRDAHRVIEDARAAGHPMLGIELYKYEDVS